MKNAGVYAIILLLAVSCQNHSLTSNGKPSWISSPPEDPNHLFAVGVADRGKSLAETRQQAVDSALRIMAIQIKTRILTEEGTESDSSDSLLSILVHQSDSVEKESEVEIEGLRIVEEYSDRNGYWVLASMKKDAVERIVKMIYRDEAPYWALNPPSDPMYLFAVGVANRDTSLSVTRQRAIDDGLRLLASQLAVKVESNHQVARQMTSVTIQGMSVNQEYFNRKGYWVLLTLPLGTANKLLMDKIEKSQQLYKKFRASKAYDELNKELESFESAQQDSADEMEK